jgi:hypothetical protein
MTEFTKLTEEETMKGYISHGGTGSTEKNTMPSPPCSPCLPVRRLSGNCGEFRLNRIIFKFYMP